MSDSQPVAAPARAHVEIRRYATAEDFHRDAGLMAQYGWLVVAQSEVSGGTSGATTLVGVLVIVAGLLFFWPLLIVGVLVLILAAVNRSKQVVVTYRYTP